MGDARRRSVHRPRERRTKPVSSTPPSNPRLNEAAPPDDFLTLWKTLEFDDRTALLAPAETIRPPVPPLPFDTAEEETLDGRPHVMERPDAELVMLRTIGEGGMGVVRLAHQKSLRREVAVKTLRPEGRTADRAASLLQEAYVNGNLEHPNIVPVHLVSQASDGSPVIVMKRVEGIGWRDFLEGRRAIPDGADPVEWHLDVLIQVTNAVSFAHSRGILHRDIKPENVMIGGFGEVYLLDWGLAVSTRDHDRGTFPLASEVRGIAGTPAYMAPEMTIGTGAFLGPATDVYLLGATLHEIVTGQARHSGADVKQVLQSAHASPPFRYADEVPRELAEICNKATAREPKERFSTAEDFRAAIARYLRHRGSIALSTEAGARLAQLQAITTKAPQNTLLDRRVRDLFGECRFGFQQALRAWPKNEEARAGMRSALRLMATHELDARNASSARALLEEMGGDESELSARLAALETELAAEREEVLRLRERARQTDRKLNARGRALAALVFGAGAGGSLFVIHALQAVESLRLTHMQYALGWGVILTACSAWLVYKFRGALWTNQVNKQVVIGFVVALVSILGFRLVIWSAGIPLELAFRIELIIYGMCMGMFAVLTNPRAAVTLPICIAGALLDSWITNDGLMTVGGTVFAAFAGLAFVWAHDARNEEGDAGAPD